MTERQIKITGAETKEGKTGKPYKNYTTSDGKMSCFEAKVWEELNKYFDRLILVEVQERNGFKNITKFINVLEAGTPTAAAEVSNEQTTQKITTGLSQLTPSLPMEKDFKIKIQQSAKGFSYFEVSVSSNKLDELPTQLTYLITLAKAQVEQLNAGLPLEQKNEAAQ